MWTPQMASGTITLYLLILCIVLTSGGFPGASFPASPPATGGTRGQLFPPGRSSSSDHRRLTEGDWYQAEKLQTSDGAAWDYLGYSAAGISTSSFVSGAIGVDMGNFSGAAYIFTLGASNSSWVQAAKVVASDGGDSDYLGCSVSSLGNSTIVAGASADYVANKTGAAYVYTSASSGSWVQAAKVVASDSQKNDYFGHSVVSLSNSSLVAGAFGAGIMGNTTGAAYVFTAVGPGSWVQTAKVVSSDGQQNDYFGHSVATLSSTYLVAGAYGDDDTGDVSSGAMYIFTTTKTSGSWVQESKLVASDCASYDYFGFSVATLSSSSLVAGAYGDDDMGSNSGSAYVFTTVTPGSWLQTAKVVASDGSAFDYLGYSLAGLSDSSLVAGAYGLDETGVGNDVGAAYVFTLSSGSWAQANTSVMASDAAAGDKYGYAVAGLSSDRFVSGAYGDDAACCNQYDAGSVYVFERSTPTLSPSLAPTLVPTLIPTLLPSLAPTLAPTLNPTLVPTLAPTLASTLTPTQAPISNSTLEPTTSSDDADSDYAPPELFGAMFSNSGAKVMVEFSKATDLGTGAGLDASVFDCSVLLNFTGAGADTRSCAWQSRDRVAITLGTESTLIPGDSVTLLPGVIKSECIDGFESLCSNMTYATEQNMTIAGPISPVMPVVVPIYAELVSGCSDAGIDVSSSLGSGGRSFHYWWRLHNTSLPSTPAALAKMVAVSNESYLSLPSSLLTPGTTYNLTVYLQNFLGGNASKDVSFHVSDEAIPSLTLWGPTSIHIYDALEVLAEAAPSNCSISNLVGGDLVYTWEVVGEEQLLSTSSNPRLFKLEAYSLLSNTAYTIRSTVLDKFGRQNSASLVIPVKQGELIASVLGGDRRIGTGNTLLLDGRQSSDMENPTGNTSGVDFAWRRVSGQTVGLDLGSADVSNGGSTVALSSPDLLAGSYEFSLQLREGDRISNNASVAVEVVNETMPLDTKITYVLAGKVNPGSKLVVPSTVVGLTSARRQRKLQKRATIRGTHRRRKLASDAFEAVWSLENTYPIFTSFASLEGAARTELTLSVTGQGEALFYLVVAAGELVGGSTYSFRLEAGPVASSAAASVAVLTVEINAPPSSGAVEASPAAGGVLQDTFELRTYNWADDPDDFPLSYRFFFRHGGEDGSGDWACGGEGAGLLQARSPANVAAGLHLPAGNVSVGAEALDRYGAAGRACAAPPPAVAALPASTPGAEIVALALGAAGRAVGAGDPVGALNAAGIGAGAYRNASGRGAASFQRRLLGVLTNATILLDASEDSIGRLADSLSEVVSLSASPVAGTLQLVLNLSGSALGWGAELGALPGAAAVDLTDVLGDVLAHVEPGAQDAGQLSKLVNELTKVLAADLVEGEQISELVSRSNLLSTKVGRFSAAVLAGQTFTPALSSYSTNDSIRTSQVVLNASAALTVALSEFSTEIHNPSQTANGTSAQLSSTLRLGISGAAGALSSLTVTIQFQRPAIFRLPEIETITVHCTIDKVVNYLCNGRMHSYTCGSQVGPFNFTCTSAMSAPSCDIHNGTYWDSSICEVLNHTTKAVTCLCPSKSLLSSSAAWRRRLTVCNANNDCEEAEAYEVDLVANILDIKSEIVSNFVLAEAVFADFGLVQQNYIVFITMGSILVGIPFLACVGHFLHAKERSRVLCFHVGKTFKGSLLWRRKLRRMSVMDNIGRLSFQVRYRDSYINREDVDLAQTFFQGIQRKEWDGLKESILGSNEYLQLFQPEDWKSCAVIVLRVLVVLLTIMFWDCTICAVVFPPGVNDCYFIPSPTECLTSSLNCGWDPYSQGCAPYSLEDTPDAMLFVSALTLAITIPIMAFLEWFMVHTIEVEVPDPAVMEEAKWIEKGWLAEGDGAIVPAGEGQMPGQSNCSLRAFMTPKSRQSLLDHNKLDGAQVDILVEERMEVKTKQSAFLRWLGLGQLLRNAVRRDVVLGLNLQQRLAEACGNPQDQDALLLEAAWCDVMGDRTFALFQEYVVGGDEKATSNPTGGLYCITPPPTRRKALSRKAFGWAALFTYCALCAFYICLFGVNYSEDYTVGWLKAFVAGLATDMLLLSPLLALVVFIASRALARRPSLEGLRALPCRPSSSGKSPAVIAATLNPDLIVSKVMLDPSFVPPVSWKKRYNIHESSWKAASHHHKLLKILRKVNAFAALAFLILPPDIQSILVQGCGVLALYYGTGFFLANYQTEESWRWYAYGIVFLAACFLLGLWGYVLMPHGQTLALWNRLRPKFKRVESSTSQQSVASSDKPGLTDRLEHKPNPDLQKLHIQNLQGWLEELNQTRRVKNCSSSSNLLEKEKSQSPPPRAHDHMHSSPKRRGPQVKVPQILLPNGSGNLHDDKEEPLSVPPRRVHDTYPSPKQPEIQVQISKSCPPIKGIDGSSVFFNKEEPQRPPLRASDHTH